MDYKQLLIIYPEFEHVIKHPLIQRLKKIRLSNPPKYSCYDHAVSAARMSFFMASVLKYRHIHLNVTDEELEIVTLSSLLYFTGTPPFGPFCEQYNRENILAQSAKNATVVLSAKYPQHLPWIKYIIHPAGSNCPNPERLFLSSIVNGVDDTLGSINLDCTWRRGSLLEDGHLLGFHPVDLMISVIINNHAIVCMNHVSNQYASYKLLKRYLENEKTEIPVSIDIDNFPYFSIFDDASILEEAKNINM